MQHLPVGAEDARRPALPAQVHVRGMRGASLRGAPCAVPHLQGRKQRSGPRVGVSLENRAEVGNTLVRGNVVHHLICLCGHHVGVCSCTEKKMKKVKPAYLLTGA